MRKRGGILNIIGGCVGIGIGAMVLSWGGLSGVMSGFVWFGAIGVPYIVLGVIAIIGGIYALQAKMWVFSLISAILCIVCGGIFGVLATIFIALRKSEFS